MTAFSLLPAFVQILIIALLVTFGTYCLITVLRGVFHLNTPASPPPPPPELVPDQDGRKANREKLWRQYYALAPVFHRRHDGVTVYSIGPRELSDYSPLAIYFRTRQGEIEWSMGNQRQWSDEPIPQSIYKHYGE